MKKTSPKDRCGFCLAEALMATVVLAIASCSLLLPFTSGIRTRAEGIRRTVASGLAADLAERIIDTRFADIVGNYNYTESQGNVTDSAGAAFTDAGYANFSRVVNCGYVYVPQENGAATPKFILATIRVYYSGREIATVNRLISN